MPRFRLLIAILLALALFAAACADDDASTTAPAEEEEAPPPAEEEEAPPAEEEEAPPAEEEEAPPAEEEEAPPPAEEEAACAANTEGDVRGIDKENGVIKIGTSQPFTGAAAVAGEGLLGGLILRLNEINEAGGIDGCVFELAWEDDRFEIEQMVINVRKLIEEDGVWAFVGTAGSQAIPSTYPAITGAGTPLWGPVSPADQDIQEVYLTNPTRTEQGRICIDYFAEQGVTKMATIGQDNELGDEAFAATDVQAAFQGIEVTTTEEVEVLSTVVEPAVLSVIDSGAEAVLTALDNIQNGLILDQFFEAGFDVLMCSDAGSAGSGGLNTVGLANPDAANGYLGALQVALTDSTDPFVQGWSAAWDAYDGDGKANGAPNFSLQSYSIATAFFELVDRLDGNYAYENFHAVAEVLANDPILVPSIPPVGCGPLPGGHSCAFGAGVAQYDAATETWTQVRDFQAPQS